MAALFTPKNEVAEWRLVYDHLTGLNPGDVVTYETFEDILGRDLRDNRQPYYRAVRELLTARKRTLEAVNSIGYRVVEAKEHERLALGREKRARRQVTRGLETIRGARQNEMTSEQRTSRDTLEARLGQHDQMLSRHGRRIASTEKRQERTEQATADVAQRVEQIAAALARHGFLDEVA